MYVLMEKLKKLRPINANIAINYDHGNGIDEGVHNEIYESETETASDAQSEPDLSTEAQASLVEQWMAIGEEWKIAKEEDDDMTNLKEKVRKFVKKVDTKYKPKFPDRKRKVCPYLFERVNSLLGLDRRLVIY